MITDQDYEKAKIQFVSFIKNNPCFFQLVYIRNGLHSGYTSDQNVAIYREGQRQAIQIIQDINKEGQEIINNQQVKGVINDRNINAANART